MVLAFLAAHAFAAEYPAKPVRIIAPFPPGGSVDLVARLVGNDLGKPLGQQIIVDNRTGASGMIGTELAKNAAPDGYTLLVNTLPFVTNQFAYDKAPRPDQRLRARFTALPRWRPFWWRIPRCR